MAASDQATSSASPGGYFNLTQIVEEHSQAAVAFRKPFDGKKTFLIRIWKSIFNICSRSEARALSVCVQRRKNHKN